MSDSVDSRLAVLVADADIEQSMRALLTRTEELGIAPVHVDMERHPNRDNGCRTQAASPLRRYLKSHRFALVVFDRDGCGSPRSRVEIQQAVELDLKRNGWDDRAKVIVIDPEEIEAWVWSESPAVAQALGWGSDWPRLRGWLRSRGLWASGRGKPPDPKRAALEATRGAGLARRTRLTSATFHDLATKVDFTGCTDPAFVELVATLRAWFPPEAAR